MSVIIHFQPSGNESLTELRQMFGKTLKDSLSSQEVPGAYNAYLITRVLLYTEKISSYKVVKLTDYIRSFNIDVDLVSSFCNFDRFPKKLWQKVNLILELNQDNYHYDKIPTMIKRYGHAVSGIITDTLTLERIARDSADYMTSLSSVYIRFHPYGINANMVTQIVGSKLNPTFCFYDNVLQTLLRERGAYHILIDGSMNYYAFVHNAKLHKPMQHLRDGRWYQKTVERLIATYDETHYQPFRDYNLEYLIDKPIVDIPTRTNIDLCNTLNCSFYHNLTYHNLTNHNLTNMNSLLAGDVVDVLS